MVNTPEPLARETSRKLPLYHLYSLSPLRGWLMSYGPVIHRSVQDRMCRLSEVEIVRHSGQGDQRLEQ